VVDDVDINREIIIELLSSANLSLETAANGQEAVDKFSSQGEGYFDIILMDMQMPVMGGCAATENIRRIEREWAENNNNAKAVPIIALTANVMHDDIRKALESGMNTHLGKPIELETTLRAIREQLR
jgi:CheY-like chemotaxis protein